MNQNFKFFKIYVCFKQSNFLVENEIEYSSRYLFFFFFFNNYSPFVKMTFKKKKKVEKMTCFD